MTPAVERRSTAVPRSARDVVAVLYRQAGLIALCALVGSVVALALYLRQPRVYASTAKVWVQPEQQGAPTFMSGIAAYREAPGPESIHRRIETEIELMLTRTNAQAVVEKYAVADGQLLHRGHRLWPGAAAASGPAGARDRQARTVDLFLDGISVGPLRSKTGDGSSNVLEVRFECTDAALAPVALQAFLDNYLRLGAQQNRRVGETTSRLVEAKLAQAREDLRQSEERIVTLLVQDGGGSAAAPAAGPGSRKAERVPASTGVAADGGGLRLDLDPELAIASMGRGGMPAAATAPTLEPPLRLDEARQPRADAAENVHDLRSQQRLARTVRENTQLEAELNRLERARQLAQERFVDLQRRLDQIDLTLHLDPTEAERRVIIDAPDHPTLAEGRKPRRVALLGPLAGLLLGLVLAGLRELGGDRMRSVREAERALGVPVLGGIPTLSAKARNAYFGPRLGTSAGAAAEGA